MTKEELLEEQQKLTVRVREYTSEAQSLRRRLSQTKDELEVVLGELEYYLSEQTKVNGLLENLK